jgi:hypothetical protein
MFSGDGACLFPSPHHTQQHRTHKRFGRRRRSLKVPHGKADHLSIENKRYSLLQLVLLKGHPRTYKLASLSPTQQIPFLVLKFPAGKFSGFTPIMCWRLWLADLGPSSLLSPPAYKS